MTQNCLKPLCSQNSVSLLKRRSLKRPVRLHSSFLSWCRASESTTSISAQWRSCQSIKRAISSGDVCAVITFSRGLQAGCHHQRSTEHCPLVKRSMDMAKCCLLRKGHIQHDRRVRCQRKRCGLAGKGGLEEHEMQSWQPT